MRDWLSAAGALPVMAGALAVLGSIALGAAAIAEESRPGDPVVGQGAAPEPQPGPGAVPLAPDGEGVFPVRRTRVDAGEGLSIDVFVHTIRDSRTPVPCWTFVTDGLRRHGHREVALTIARESSEAAQDYPTSPITVLRAIRALAEQGHLVEVGNFSLLRGEGIEGFPCIVYVEPRPLEGVELPEDSLAGLLLRKEESAVAQVRGVWSMAARLAAAYRQYPFPVWADRDRALVPLPELVLWPSWLEIPRVRTGAMSAVHEGSVVTLRIADNVADKLSGSLRDADPLPIFALELLLDPASDSSYAIGSKDPSRPTGIHPKGSAVERLSLCHLTFASQATQPGGTIVFDGMLVTLTSKDYEQLLQSLTTKTEIRLAVARDLTLNVEFVPDGYFQQEFWGAPVEVREYVDPFTGASIRRPWHVDGGGPEAQRHELERADLILLTREAVIARNVSAQDLVSHMANVRTAMEELLQGAWASVEVCVRVDFFPGRGPTYAITSTPPLPPDLLGVLEAKLEALPELRSRRDLLRVDLWKRRSE